MKKAISLLLVLVIAVTLLALPVAAAARSRLCDACNGGTQYQGSRRGTSNEYVSSCGEHQFAHSHTVYTDWDLYKCLDDSCGYVTWVLFSKRSVCNF